MAKTEKVKIRQAAVKELIKTFPIENQSILVGLLKEKYNIQSTQSLVSRDLRSLEVGRHKYKNKMIYELKTVDVNKEILQLGVKDVVHNESMIVIKTLLGLSAFVGNYLDLQNETTILATLAGETTVFVTPARIGDTKKTFEIVCKLLHFKQAKREHISFITTKKKNTA